jgi:RNA polymerase sigma factor (sigma-70 family)
MSTDLLQNRPPNLTQLARRAVTLSLRTAAPIIGSVDEARDVAQDVAVIVLQRHGQVRDLGSFDAWVHRIAVREALRAVKKRQHQRNHERPVEGVLDAEAAMKTASGEERVMSRLVAKSALQRIPPRERAALVLRYVHDLSDEEIAAALRCRRGTVGSLLSRGRERLRHTPEFDAVTSQAIAWSSRHG